MPISDLLRRTTIRRLILGYDLVLLVITLGMLALGIHSMVSNFLWRSGENRLRAAAQAGWYAEDEEAGRPHGPLVASSDFPAGAEAIAARIAEQGLFVRILDPQGAILAESGHFRYPPPVDLEQLALSKTASPGTRVTYLAHSRRDWQVLLMPIWQGGAWIGALQVAASYRPSNELLKALSGYLLLGGCLAGLLATLMTLALVRFLSHPLNRLSQATRRVQAGDLSARTGLKGGSNEIYAVASAFDSMVEQLEETFEAQRRFVADASHELKTPLTAIGGMAELLAMGADQAQPEKRQLALRTIDKEVDRMSSLVNDLLTLSRAEQNDASHRSQLDLTLLLQEVVNQKKLLFPDHNFQLASPEPLSLTGDSEELSRVFGNLIDNAVYYSGPANSVALRAKKEDTTLVVEVEDQGVGISEKDLPHIFDRFYRSDLSRTRQTGGSGLGLAIVRALVDQHGGSVSVTSRVGQGSTFIVRLPATSP